MSKFRDLLKIGLVLALCFGFAGIENAVASFCERNANGYKNVVAVASFCERDANAYKNAVKELAKKEYVKKVFDRNCETNNFCPSPNIRKANDKDFEDALAKVEQLKSSLHECCFSENHVKKLHDDAIDDLIRNGSHYRELRHKYMEYAPSIEE
jgi:hypothetical protein